MIISNSSPLIHLTRLGKIDYLINKENNIIIPPAVFSEAVIEGKKNNYAESYIIENYINDGKITINKIGEFETSFYPPIGKGEMESLELTRQLNGKLLIDDKKARNIAHILKIKYQTTIATMFELLLSKIIDIIEYKSNILQYAENSWISADVIQEYLERGEKYGR